MKKILILLFLPFMQLNSALLERDIDLKNFFKAVSEGHMDMIVSLLKKYKADPSFINSRNSFNLTALMIAVKSRHNDVIQYLVDHGANLNEIGPEGTALDISSRPPFHKRTAEILRRYGVQRSKALSKS